MFVLSIALMVIEYVFKEIILDGRNLVYTAVPGTMTAEMFRVIVINIVFMIMRSVILIFISIISIDPLKGKKSRKGKR